MEPIHPAPKKKRRRRRRLRKRHWAFIVVLLTALTAALVFFLGTELKWADLHRALLGLNVVALLVLLVVLPPFGFSVSVIYLVIGARFGPLLGGAVVTGITAAHLLIQHVIGRTFLRDRIERYLAERKHHLPHVPEGENAMVSLMAVLVPGLPYFVRNYLLALSDVPLRIYFSVALPIYVARSYLTLFFGDLASNISTQRVVVLGGVFVLKLGISAYVIWRLRRRLKAARSPAAPDRGDVGKAHP